jgi:hypothetical protein
MEPKIIFVNPTQSEPARLNYVMAQAYATIFFNPKPERIRHVTLCPHAGRTWPFATSLHKAEDSSSHTTVLFP